MSFVSTQTRFSWYNIFFKYKLGKKLKNLGIPDKLVSMVAALSVNNTRC